MHEYAKKMWQKQEFNQSTQNMMIIVANLCRNKSIKAHFVQFKKLKISAVVFLLLNLPSLWIQLRNTYCFPEANRIGGFFARFPL